MDASICRLSTLRRLSPRLSDGRRLSGWHRADLVVSLVDGRIEGVVLRRRLSLWGGLAGALAAALGQAPVAAPARLRGAPIRPLLGPPAPGPGEPGTEPLHAADVRIAVHPRD